LAAVHLPVTAGELHDELRHQLREALPDVSFAVLHYGDSPEWGSVEVIEGKHCPHRPGQMAGIGDWGLPAEQRLQFSYRGQALGELQLGRAPDEIERGKLDAILSHYAVALGKLPLAHDAERYHACLQAMEEGVGLFQEQDLDTISARFLGFCQDMMEADAGALYVLEEVGNLDSELRLTLTLGIPEQQITEIEAASGNTWPRRLLDAADHVVHRAEDPSMGGISREAIPDVLRTMVVSTLQYHGLVAGLCVLFNPAPSGDSLALKMSSLSRLGQLGAAILHRLHLEEISRKNRELETQLKIASTIQARLLPSSAPLCPHLQCAWRSQTAQYIGGDYLDLGSGRGGETLAVIADVSGHGVDSALLMSSFRSFYRGEAPLLEPHRLLASLNKEVTHEVGTTGMFITAATFRIREDGQSLTYSGAGHNPVYLYRAQAGSIEELESQGPPLGFMASAAYEVSGVDLYPGDVLVLYTDGIVEATDRAGLMFGEERFKCCIAAIAHSSADDVLNTIFAELTNFTGQHSQQDDVSVSVLKFI
jgi:serine phosphatase RsbU (regulator of sigma subunit)